MLHLTSFIFRRSGSIINRGSIKPNRTPLFLTNNRDPFTLRTRSWFPVWEVKIPKVDEIEKAIEIGDIEVVKSVLRHCDVSSRLRNTSIEKAILYKNSKIALLLLQDPGTDPSYNDNVAIRYASSKGLIEVVRSLLQHPRVNPTTYAIQEASKNGHIDIVRLLLQDPRVDPSDNNNCAIREASKNGHIEIVRLLLSNLGVDPSDRDNLAIQLAIINGHIEVVRLLLSDPRVDPSACNNRALKTAVERGYTKIVKLLLRDPRVDSDVINDKDIEMAEEFNHCGILRLLLEHNRERYQENNLSITIQ